MRVAGDFETLNEILISYFLIEKLATLCFVTGLLLRCHISELGH